MKHAERRRHPRYPFVAVAHIEELLSQRELVANTVNISLGGCFIDMHAPLPAGAPIRITISSNGATFKALGNVVVSLASAGMRLGFETLTPDQEAVLRNWVDLAQQRSETQNENTV